MARMVTLSRFSDGGFQEGSEQQGNTAGRGHEQENQLITVCHIERIACYHRAYGPPQVPAEQHDTKQDTMRTDAEQPGHRRRDQGEEGAMTDAVHRGEQVKHPRFPGDPQPEETARLLPPGARHSDFSNQPLPG